MTNALLDGPRQTAHGRPYDGGCESSPATPSGGTGDEQRPEDQAPTVPRPRQQALAPRATEPHPAVIIAQVVVGCLLTIAIAATVMAR